MSLLDALIYGVRDIFDGAGLQLPRRSRVKFTGTVTDDQLNDMLIVETGEGGGGSAPGGPDKSLQYRVNSTTLGGDAEWTRESAARHNMAASAYWTVGAVGGVYPTWGTWRFAALNGSGDTTADANYQGITTRSGATTLLVIGTYANGDGSKEVLVGHRWDWSDANPRFNSIAFFFPVMNYKCVDHRYWVNANGQVYNDPVLKQVTSLDANPIVVTSLPVGGSEVTELELWVTARNPTGDVATFRFAATYDDGVVIVLGDLDPYRVRKTVGAAAWTCVINAGGDVIGQAVGGVKWVSRLVRLHHS